MSFSPERPPQKPPSPEAPKQATATFDTLEEAVAFVKEFWMAVDLREGERIADYPAERLRERTAGDRTVLNLYPSSLYDGKFGVLIYANSDTHPLSLEAITFLKSKGILE